MEFRRFEWQNDGDSAFRLQWLHQDNYKYQCQGVSICEHFMDWMVKPQHWPACVCVCVSIGDGQTIANEPYMHRHKYDLSDMMSAPNTLIWTHSTRAAKWNPFDAFHASVFVCVFACLCSPKAYNRISTNQYWFLSKPPNASRDIFIEMPHQTHICIFAQLQGLSPLMRLLPLLLLLLLLLKFIADETHIFEWCTRSQYNCESNYRKTIKCFARAERYHKRCIRNGLFFALASPRLATI